MKQRITFAIWCQIGNRHLKICENDDPASASPKLDLQVNFQTSCFWDFVPPAEMMATRKYSVILGNLGNTKDRFCGGYKDDPSTVEMLKAASIPNVEGIELVGSWDIRPDNVTEMKRALGDLGMACISIIPDLFAEKIYWKGSFSSPDEAVRRHAIDYTRKMWDVALEMSCQTLNIWPGQDGYDYLLTADYDSQRQRFAEGMREIPQPICSSASRSNTSRKSRERTPILPGWRTRFSWPKKRNAPTWAFASIRVKPTLRRNRGRGCENGHRAEARSPTDCNAPRRRTVGTVYSTTYLDTFYWLDRCGYEGWISIDQYPYREDAVGAIGESIQWLHGCEQIVRENREAIDQLMVSNDAVETSRFLRKVLMPAVNEG